MKIWVDDIRPAPDGYIWCKSTNAVIGALELEEELGIPGGIEIIDIDHDAGEFAFDGGDYIKVLDFMEETGRSYPIRIHSMNPVGRENMRRIIQRNGWTEVR
jgi:hypothetical protein